ncbi:MAG: hypothetical protein IV090_20970 [Candidatus Sericytochromatia bacterium]|nr:hypothetical protein [Candidatus Sericytochromatia bacterium]
MTKLNQIIAVEKGVKSRDHAEVSNLYKLIQKPELFNGITRTYRKKSEEGEDYPADRKKVAVRAQEALAKFAESKTELFDITAQKDYANCHAVANVVVDGVILLEKAPVTYLLFLEKQLNDLHTFVSSLPILDEAEDWSLDANSDLYKTQPVQTAKTKKVQRPLVMYPATTEHPAQTQLITEDIIEGYWDSIKYSAAVPLPKKQALVKRAQTLLDAVKKAREEANAVDAFKKEVGKKLFDYLLG